MDSSEAMLSNTKSAVYEFDDFRIDAGRRLLWNRDQPLTLTPKVFDTLLYLVQNAGKTIGKDELIAAVWPDTIVEENNLNKNISALRQLLGEKPGEHRFIATVPGKGYRFVASVVESSVKGTQHAGVVALDETPPSLIPAKAVESSVTDTESSKSAAVREVRPTTRRYWPWVASLVLIAVAGALVARYFVGHTRSTKLTDKDTIVLAEFTNTTGDPVFEGTLRQGLASQLEQSPFLNLLSDIRIAQTMALMSQPKEAKLTPSLAHEVCLRTTSTATIEGSISTLGSQYVLGLKAVNCGNGDVLAQEQVTADGKEQVLKALGAAATKMRGKLGESLASVQKFDVPLENVTTPSLEALQAYSQGLHAMAVSANFLSAAPLLERAISLDSNFATAYDGLGTCYWVLGQQDKARANTLKAYSLRARVSERERLFIVADYESFVTANSDAARKAYELFEQTYPRSFAPIYLGVIYAINGDYERALRQHEMALRLFPSSALSYTNIVFTYRALNRLQEAKAAAEQAKLLHLESPGLHFNLYGIAFLQHDQAAMEREAAALRGLAGVEDNMLYLQSDSAAYAGQFGRATELTQQAVSSAQTTRNKETAAAYEAEAAVRAALVGRPALARSQAQAALALSEGRDVQAMAAIALGLAGDTAQAARLGDELAKQYPDGTTIQFTYLPTIRALSLLQRGKAENTMEAVNALSAVAPYELGSPNRIDFALYPVYVRGLAYLAANKGAAAAAEFQKILDHPGVVLNEPIAALSHLQLGRAYALSGDTAKAKAAYQDFLTLWKDADPDVPILNQAKAEYALLQ